MSNLKTWFFVGILRFQKLFDVDVLDFQIEHLVTLTLSDIYTCHVVIFAHALSIAKTLAFVQCLLRNKIDPCCRVTKETWVSAPQLGLYRSVVWPLTTFLKKSLFAYGKEP